MYEQVLLMYNSIYDVNNRIPKFMYLHDFVLKCISLTSELFLFNTFFIYTVKIHFLFAIHKMQYLMKTFSITRSKFNLLNRFNDRLISFFRPFLDQTLFFTFFQRSLDLIFSAIPISIFYLLYRFNYHWILFFHHIQDLIFILCIVFTII